MALFYPRVKQPIQGAKGAGGARGAGQKTRFFSVIAYIVGTMRDRRNKSLGMAVTPCTPCTPINSQNMLTRV